jgi:hypothetical protein
VCVWIGSSCEDRAVRGRTSSSVLPEPQCYRPLELLKAQHRTTYCMARELYSVWGHGELGPAGGSQVTSACFRIGYAIDCTTTSCSTTDSITFFTTPTRQLISQSLRKYYVWPLSLSCQCAMKELTWIMIINHPAGRTAQVSFLI